MMRCALTIILLDLGQTEHFIFLIARKVFNRGRRRHKFNRIRLSNDLADILCLQILLADVARLVIEKAVGVTHPGHTTKENPTITD